MDKVEAIAGLLSTLQGSDRRWILRRLPAHHRRGLRAALKQVPSDLSNLREDIRALLRPATTEAESTRSNEGEQLEARKRSAAPVLLDLPKDLQLRIRTALDLADRAEPAGSAPTPLARAAMIRHLPASVSTNKSGALA